MWLGTKAEELGGIQEESAVCKSQSTNRHMLKWEAGTEGAKGLLSGCRERSGWESDTIRSGRY